MSQMLLVDGFKWVENTTQFIKDFVENYHEDTDEGYFLEVDIQYPDKLYDLHDDLLFLSKRIKIEKVKKLVATMHGKKEYVIKKRTLKQALNHGLVLKKSSQSHKIQSKSLAKIKH